MSQLNNDENKGEKKKSHFARNSICFLILFASICVAITIYLINLKTPINEIVSDSHKLESTENAEKRELVDDGVKGVQSLYETYRENNLEISNYVYCDKAKDGSSDFIDELETVELDEVVSTTDYEVSAYYIQIDGLKNKDVQKKINKKIKSTTLEFMENTHSDDMEYFNVTAYAIGNFADVLSISLYGYGTYDDEEKWTNVASGINIDLSTGEEIHFKDLFTYNTSLKNILSHSIYNALAREYVFEGSTDMRKVDYSEIENNSLKLMSKYNSNPDIDFYFSPSSITAIIDNQEIQIQMSKYAKQIAIYNRYKTSEDLFESHKKFESTFNVFLPNFDSNQYYRYEKVSDNLYVNIILPLKTYSYDLDYAEYDLPEEELESKLDEINKKIDEYKNMNDNKGRYYTYSSYSYEDGKFYFSEQCITCDIDYFKNVFLPYAVEECMDFAFIEPGMTYVYYENLDDDMKAKVEVEENDNYEHNDEFFEEDFIEDIKNEDIDIYQKIIVIDAGHQEKGDNSEEPIGPGATETKAKVTGGATGVSTRQTEYELNLEVSLLLQEKLEKLGYEVVMTRTTNDVNISNSERAEIANSINADAFIRIHANSADSSSAKGVITMCQTDDNIYNGYLADESYRLSKLIVDNIAKETGTKNRGVTRTDEMSGINWATVPTTIVEMGFLSNEEEDKLLATKEYQEKIVDGIINGLSEFFE